MIFRIIILINSTLFLAPNIQATLFKNLSDFERKAVEEAMDFYKLKPAINPDNKKIDNIYIYTQEPFTQEAGFLQFFNTLHIDTREQVIRNELFIQPGDFYKAALIQDSELALRRLSLVRSLAVIVPVQGAEESEVALLVVTRDILSLRPNFDFSASSWSLRDLELAISLGEHNLMGYNKSLGASYELKQGMHIIASRYFDPNLFGSRYELLLKPALVFARNTFKLDGFLAEFELRKPLISMSEKWGYGLEARLGTKPVIDFKGGNVRLYKETIESRYRWSYGEGKINLRRSFGSIYKREIFTSYNINIKKPSIPQDLIILGSMRDDFINNILPKNEIESYINIGFAYFENKYLTLYDYNNFKLQEVKSLGPMFKISNDFAAQTILFSDQNFLRPNYACAYTQALGSDAFISLSSSGTSRFDGAWSDNTFKFGLSLASPQFFKLARIVADGRLSLALNNRDNLQFTLGSELGLRGVESRYYKGPMGFRTNIEIRSAPFQLWILHAGFVVFYDTGAAFKSWRDAQATQSVGFGLRILAPQVSSELFRIDLGFPVYGRTMRENVVIPSLGLGQAF